MVRYFVLILCLLFNTNSWAQTAYQKTNLALLESMVKRNAQLAQAAQGPRVFYVGLALWGGGEKWSENDILDVQSILKAKYPAHTVIPYIINNGTVSPLRLEPTFQPDILQSILVDIQSHARPEDLTVLAWSTHGRPKQIFARIGQHQINFADRFFYFLRDNMGTTDRLLILSSCYAGSTVPFLLTRHTTILAASEADKTSFGCSAESENSWFIRAMEEEVAALGANAPSTSWQHIMAGARKRISAWEAQHGYTPSNPEMHIGHDVQTSRWNF